jgi:hypothetical protein
MHVYTVWTIVIVLSIFHLISASLLLKHARKCDKTDCVRDQTYAIIVLVMSSVSILLLSNLMYNKPPPPDITNVLAPIRKTFR